LLFLVPRPRGSCRPMKRQQGCLPGIRCSCDFIPVSETLSKLHNIVLDIATKIPMHREVHRG
jgi:hypothetical protein